MNFLELNGRLKKIADLTDKCNTLADVGCDHGYIPVYCIQKSFCNRAIAMDINTGPLERCRENILKYGLEDKIETRLSDGVAGLSYGEADCIVIAGMGGLLIRDILSNGILKIKNGTKLVLQPMLAPLELREYLYNNGFDIKDEYVAREDNKFYNIIEAQKVEYKPLFDYSDLVVGKNLKKNSNEVFKDYIEYKISVTQKILAGLDKAKNTDISQKDIYLKQLKTYQEV